MVRVRDSLTYKYRGAIGIICLSPLALFVLFSPPLIQNNTWPAFLMDFFGWLSFAGYLTFRLWSTLFVGGKKDKELQTEGPYSITRNPLYFGSFCFSMSIAFFLRSPILLVGILFATFLYNHLVIKIEEKFLEETFGDSYREFLKTVPRLVPKPSLLKTPAVVEVRLKGMKQENKRMWVSILMPFTIQIFHFLRMQSWWPQLFSWSKPYVWLFS